jgi:hypothetical protein
MVPAAFRPLRYVEYSTSVHRWSKGLLSSKVPGIASMTALPWSEEREGQLSALAAVSRSAYWVPSDLVSRSTGL